MTLKTCIEALKEATEDLKAMRRVTTVLDTRPMKTKIRQDVKSVYDALGQRDLPLDDPTDPPGRPD